MRHISGTFSIAACDSETNVYGAAVTTGTAAAGAIYPYAGAGGATVTQSYTKLKYGRGAVTRAKAGERINDAFESPPDDDDHAACQQVYGVGMGGESALTGGECVSWVDHRVGDDYTVTGNMLAGEGVVEATARAYEATDSDIVEQLVSALGAGESVGGDDHGELNAALLVRTPTSKSYHSLRVDLSDDPVADPRGLLSEARRAKAQIRRETDMQLGDYPDEILEFGVKY